MDAVSRAQIEQSLREIRDSLKHLRKKKDADVLLDLKEILFVGELFLLRDEEPTTTMEAHP